MIDAVKVLVIMEDLYGVDSSELSSCLPISTAASNEIHHRLKDEKNENDRRVLIAAAALTFYRYTLKRVMSDEAMLSFKAGDVTTSQSPSLMLQTAANIRDEAFVSAAPLLKDIDFMFEVM